MYCSTERARRRRRATKNGKYNFAGFPESSENKPFDIGTRNVYLHNFNNNNNNKSKIKRKIFIRTSDEIKVHLFLQSLSNRE